MCSAQEAASQAVQVASVQAWYTPALEASISLPVLCPYLFALRHKVHAAARKKSMNLNYPRFAEVWNEIPTDLPNGPLLDAAGKGWFSTLTDRYYEPWRYYHNGDHIEAVQDALDTLGCTNTAVRIAAYWHDIFWLPGYPLAEERSAELAELVLYQVYANDDFIESVKRIIMSTKHDGLKPLFADEAMMRDADLWNLGDDYPDKFRWTQENVRKEFASVNSDDYRRARRFLFTRMARNQLYWTELGSERESQARENCISLIYTGGDCDCRFEWLDAVHYERICDNQCLKRIRPDA